MDQSILSTSGAPAIKPTKFAPMGTKRFFTGLVKSRSPLQEPGTRAESRFYGGRPDALWDGQNVEISANNTPIRRPGFSPFSTLPSPALSFCCFRPPLQPITVIADTALGPYVISAGSTPTTPLFPKTGGAGQTYMQPVGTQIFFTDGIDQWKWDGTHLWKWGIAPPPLAPTLQITYGAPLPTPVLTATVAGSLTGQGTIYVQVTGVGPFGETLSSAEALLAVPNGSELVVAFPAVVPTNVVSWNVYAGTSSGTETLQNTTPLPLTVNYTFTGAPTTTGAAAPAITSAASYTILSVLGVSYGYCFQNAYTDHVSTMSPASPYTGPQTNVNITLGGVGSMDPQVTTIQIYRTTDGGATWLFMASIANPAPIILHFPDGGPSGSDPGAWTYIDPGIADSGLNAEIIAPQALANNPPPAGLTCLAYFGGSIFGAVGSYLRWSNGLLTTNGSGNESWPPLNFALLPSDIVALIPYPNGMMIQTVDDLWYVSGPGATPQIALPGLGSPSYNASDWNGSSTYIFTSDANLLQVTPGAGYVDMGFNIAGEFPSITPSSAHVAYHIMGHRDNACFLLDGGTGTLWRCNPNQQPEGGAVWSTAGVIQGGATAMASIETSVGVHQLLIASGNEVLFRDWTISTDNGASYDAFLTIGSIVFALPGQLCEVQSVTIEASRVGSRPGVSVLIGEVEGTFEALINPVADPPGLPESQSLFSSRFYLNQSKQPVVCRHLQLKIDFGQDEVQNELLSYSFYGALHQE